MNIAITGASGFLGRELIRQFASDGCKLRCMSRQPEIQNRLENVAWFPGELGNNESIAKLVANQDAVVHAGLWRTTDSFRGSEPDLIQYLDANMIGSLRLMLAAREAGVKKFVFVSSCAVHDRILDDRPLDEAHPLWASNHYGAHKAAVEQFVHSFGFGEGFDICALRPTTIYGVDSPLERSRWFKMVQDICDGEPVVADGGGKLVHVADVARAIRLLLGTEGTAGECYSCCEGYFANLDVAQRIKNLAGSDSKISGALTKPKNTIDDSKLRDSGLTYGGETLLEQTLELMINEVKG